MKLVFFWKQVTDMETLCWKRGTNYYDLYADGRIGKDDGYMSDGKSWEFVGLVEVKPFGMLGPVIPRKECFALKNDLYFQNGKYKYRVVDKDHGTTRVWGS